MKKYVCKLCGWVYDPILGDPDNNVPAGTPFEKVPSDWVCPVCGAGKDEFELENQKLILIIKNKRAKLFISPF